MRFGLSGEQRAFGEAVESLLSAADVTAARRSWAAGDPAAGQALWGRLAELGVAALGVPEELGGLGGTPLDRVVALDRIGYHGVPGPVVESLAVAPVLLAGTAESGLLERVAGGEARVTFALPPHTPYALDADSATHVFLAAAGTLSRARVARELTSVDPARRLAEITATDEIGALDEATVARALDHAALATSAVLVGAGQRLLDEAVTYVGQRRQFGRVIGEYQAIKHLLADVRVALDFARPLLHGAALELGGGSAVASRDVSAAKVAASDAAHLAARTALQVHGAVGYTLELDLSLWLLQVRALLGVWGTPGFHRARVLDHLTGV
ncbi:acyl-CoA dehydrogenase family protein [Nocardioides sp. cx-173]|uniref:acyl-CoA dehydrogenase family protein n=1 Tax=Nocardioides sp. cx-173 TaxID=2898796 RepID=UPI001E50D2ED|nr:acyl-CoA dehydrogenase family protein [Nocardioides sp. cx-173]MCD4524125.1 acyl-CoA/acyl-ACP dehydrogenase [Nocardioides sp. cx-173]UGB41522.1 acyl-CoA/acyl-ACP dehydrogenase [Nocardioides sp. cx-173]